MNCKQAEKLLPLFGGDDLSERLQQPLSQHLKSCASCAAAAGDYRQSSELLQEFAAPVFSDDLFAEMRRNVWQQINTEPPRKSLTQVFRGWLHLPMAPMVWAAAMALLVAVLALGIYFLGRGVSTPGFLAGNSLKSNDDTAGNASHPDKPAAPLSPREKGRDQRQADFGRSRRRLNRLDRRAPGRAPSLALNSPDTATSKREGSAQVNSSFDPRAAVSGSEKTLRLEMQTRNPNIRIIWFTQKEPKSLSPNSKGT